jgi:hypothetical protein
MLGLTATPRERGRLFFHGSPLVHRATYILVERRNINYLERKTVLLQTLLNFSSSFSLQKNI